VSVRAPVEHELKIWPEFFDDVASGRKPFDVRFTDRDFQTDDILRLREYAAVAPTGYTGRETCKRVSYVLPGGRWGLSPPWCVLGLAGFDPAPAMPFSGLIAMLSRIDTQAEMRRPFNEDDFQAFDRLIVWAREVMQSAPGGSPAQEEKTMPDPDNAADPEVKEDAAEETAEEAETEASED
jgi:hypothetical protein